MFALSHASLTLLHAGQLQRARALIDELIEVADQKATLYWKAYGLLLKGWLAALTGYPAEGVEKIMSGISAMRSTGATGYAPWYQSILARAHAEAGQLTEAKRAIDEAIAQMEITGEQWCEADVRACAAEIGRMIAKDCG